MLPFEEHQGRAPGLEGQTTTPGIAAGSSAQHRSTVTHPTASRTATGRVAPALSLAAIVVAAVALGLYARAPRVPGAAGAGRALPRVAAPPPDLPTLLHLLGVGSVPWYAAALGLPVLLWGARRLDAARLGRARTIVLVVAVVAALVLVTALAQYAVVYGGASLRPPLGAFLPEGIRQALLPWIALAGIVAAVEWRRRAVRSAVEHERLRAEVAEQRLKVLTGQLHPHFLFNTLQGISTLIHRDADAADEMLAKLGDLLRDLLRHRDHVLVPLEDELRYARTYLEIAQLRFGDRLQWRIAVPPELHALPVPLFILQPLIENALSHGIGRRARGGCIAVEARRRGDRVELLVTDDGDGLPAATGQREGIGLSNTRERLRASYGADHAFHVGAGERGGVAARLEVPWLEVPWLAAPAASPAALARAR